MQKIHFIGIAGIGMSALAGIYLAKGSAVTGSDLRPNNLTDELERNGATIHRGHRRDNVDGDVDIVVRSACIRDDNPEIVRAKETGIQVVSRSEFLRKFIEEAPFSIGVTGTHGKTTTSALISHIIEQCGQDPTVLVGGEMECFGSNSKFGRGEMVVAEVDESDGYFRNINTTCAVVTNIEKEHMENFGSLEALTGAYSEFISRISPRGFFIFNGEDPVLSSLTDVVSARKIIFGIDGDFDVTCEDHSYDRSIEFNFVMRGRNYGKVASSLVGRYNLMNILGAMAVCMETGFSFDSIVEAVRTFRGVKRRFETVDRIGNIRVIEDYAHHPTELKAVIRAARDYGEGRVITIFQPHRFSRTRDLAREFIDCFYGSDVLILTDIYSADEEAIEGVALDTICEAMDKSRFEIFRKIGKREIPEFVSAIVKENDIILVLGAGDIRDIAAPLIAMI